MGVLFQILSTAILCAMSVNMGFIMVWPACTIMMFGSNETTLNRPMTQNEISLLGSLTPIGGMLSTLAAGFMLDKLGRKKCSITVAACLTMIWAALAAFRQVEVVLTCVFFSGIGTSIFLIEMVYISEICQESIRGSMTATNMVAYGIGMLLLYLLGGYLPYDVLLYVGVSMSAVSMSLLFILKDSPVYLMKIGKEKEAAESIAFLRQLKVHDKEVIEEINNIKSSLNPELDESTPESEKLNPELKPENEKLSFWQFMKKSKSTRRALVVTMVVLTSSIFQGLSVVQIYVESLFTAAIPSMPPMLCSVVMAAIMVIAGVVAAYLTDMAGRRPLMIYGSIGTGVCCLILGTQMQLQWGPTWMTAVLLYVYPVVYTVGAGTVPMVLFAELFLPEVKSILSMVSVEWTMLCYAISLYIFNPLLDAIGWGPVFYIFGIMSFLTAIFSVFFLPETKGLTVEEIQPLFLSKKERNHC